MLALGPPYLSPLFAARRGWSDRSRLSRYAGDHRAAGAPLATSGRLRQIGGLPQRGDGPVEDLRLPLHLSGQVLERAAGGRERLRLPPERRTTLLEQIEDGVDGRQAAGPSPFPLQPPLALHDLLDKLHLALHRLQELARELRNDRRGKRPRPPRTPCAAATRATARGGSAQASDMDLTAMIAAPGRASRPMRCQPVALPAVATRLGRPKPRKPRFAGRSQNAVTMNGVIGVHHGAWEGRRPKRVKRNLSPGPGCRPLPARRRDLNMAEGVVPQPIIEAIARRRKHSLRPVPKAVARHGSLAPPRESF